MHSSDPPTPSDELSSSGGSASAATSPPDAASVPVSAAVPHSRPARRRGLSTEDSASRITAYVYGNIVVLATLVPLGQAEAEQGRSFAIVLGVSFATFLAHVFAESAGRRARRDTRLSRSDFRSELRDSAPVLSSGLVPALVLAIAWLTGFPGLAAQLIAEAYVVLRLAFTGVIIQRIRGEASSIRTIIAGVVLALVGAGISLVKVMLGH
ncbi:MAG: hypothetical protein ACTJHU_09170 [Mycetocola sp.]